MALPFQDREKPLSVVIDESSIQLGQTVGNSADSLATSKSRQEETVWIRSAGRESRGTNATMGASPDALE